MMVQEQAYKDPDVINFLDRARIHRRRLVKDFLAEGAAARVHLEFASGAPAYAPELNPDEGGWNCLKRAELRTSLHDLDPVAWRTPIR